jgi:hypothetical protein
VNRVKYFGAVIARSAAVANTDCNALEDYKTLLVLKSLSVDLLRLNGSLAVLATIAVGS